MTVLQPVGVHNELDGVRVPFEIQPHRHCWQGKLRLYFSRLSMKKGLDPVDPVLLRLGFPVLPTVDGCKRDAEGSGEGLLRQAQPASNLFDTLRVHKYRSIYSICYISFVHSEA
jgi:hypothetical protein